LDTSGNLRVNVVAGSGANPAASSTGSAVPASADYQGLNVSGTLRGATGTNTSGSVYAADVNVVAAPAVTYNSTQPTLTNGQTESDFQIGSRGGLIVTTGLDGFTLSALPAGSNVIGHVIADSGSTTTVTQSTNANLKADVTSNAANIATEASLVKLPVAQASTTSGQSGPLVQGAVTTAAPTYTTAQTSPLSLTTAGALRHDMTSIAGTTADTNSGNKSAGTLRVVLATDQPQLTNKLLVTPDANSAVNIAQMNGVTVTMNNGTAGTGVQRVAIASDNTVLPAVGAGATASAVPANAVYPGSQDASGNLIGDIDCTSSKIYDASTSGNTELVAISGSKHIYVCGYEFFSAGTVNVSLVTGTGTACASAASGTPSTGTSGASAALTPAWQFTTQTGKLSAYPTHGFLIDTGSANALCLKTSGGVAVQAQIFYSQR
jgi:hypothetical protein